MRKVLHIVGSMARGGVETWLMHVMRNIDRNQFQFHFLVNSESEAAYDPEILSIGGRIHYGAHPSNPLQYAKEFAAVVHKHGPFAAVHSHVYWYSGLITRLAYQAGIPIRIAHSHTATSAPVWKVHRRTYQILMRSLIMRYATHRIAASRRAGEALFGCRSEPSFRLLYYGMDFTRFLSRRPTDESKRRLGIPPERKVIGHVGRFVPVKNHAFLIEVFERIVGSGMDAHLLLVGDGPGLAAVRNQLHARGLLERCTFAGSQSDVVPYFSAMDVFVLPSWWEGFSLVALESQASGVPVIASAAVPEDMAAIPHFVARIPLSDGVSSWASTVSRTLEQPGRRSGDEPMFLQNSKFGLPVCLEALSNIYVGG
jgi:glycosyltransferase involved in cell wall biosynthesis